MQFKKKFFSLILLCTLGTGCSQDDKSIKHAPRTSILITRDQYQLGFDTQTKQPNWILQKVNDSSFYSSLSESMDDYYPDVEIPKDLQGSSSDYVGSNFIMSSLLFPNAEVSANQKESRTQYLFSITSPQNPEFYRGYWKKLRSRVKEIVQNDFPAILVFSGPLFLPRNGEVTYPVIGSNNIPVPTHFFRSFSEDQN